MADHAAERRVLGLALTGRESRRLCVDHRDAFEALAVVQRVLTAQTLHDVTGVQRQPQVGAGGVFVARWLGRCQKAQPPAGQRRPGAWTHHQRRVVPPPRTQKFAAHAWSVPWAYQAGMQHCAVAETGAQTGAALAVDHGDLRAAALQVDGAAQAQQPGTDDDDVHGVSHVAGLGRLRAAPDGARAHHAWHGAHCAAAQRRAARPSTGSATSAESLWRTARRAARSPPA
jgi:hypothetical protein